MTSRPGPGIQESLQHRGGGPAYAPVRRAVNPQHSQLDTTAENERGSTEERVSKARHKGKPIPLDGIQTTLSDSVRPAPKGKPQIFFSSVPLNGIELTTTHSQSIANLPVPPRPGSSVPGDTTQQYRILPGGTGVKEEAVAKPQGHDTPAPAVVFPDGKTADLFPWVGNHPEDVLSDALVKGGISNKSQIMNETNTARPSLWSNLKNKSGISTLSSLFVAVLEKRQSCNRLTTPNTFKPPPRLTLRDSTRETWLHDLANPTVGLRRLSRTIPHGITGKVLLEQCLNKNIPIPRAMWLAKCVGINEMRAHKRKGQAGTITWVRGWTSSVEQFLEGTVAAIGQQDWKPRITYALQLVTHLFKEHLLEEDHFLDWILKGLDSCSSERLFVWILIVCIPDFWLGLISSRRRGKRLAESLLGHLEKKYGVDEELRNTPVLSLLENIILKLIVTKPACLLLPKTWHRHGAILHTLAQQRPQANIARAITHLDERNKQIIRPLSASPSLSQDTDGRIYRLLDATNDSANVSIDELSFDCMEITSEINRLISLLLKWASSLYRQGSHRVYLATRLLRKWSHLGADVYDGILAYLPHIASDPSKDPNLVFRIVAELVRSKTFSPGRYFQWLIATGSLTYHQDLHSPSAWPLRLLTEMPLAGLSAHIQNLRRTLLRGTVYSVEAEEHAIITTCNAIRQQLPGLFDTENINTEIAAHDIMIYSRTVRLEIGTWLRQVVAEMVEVVECIPTKDPSVEVTGTVCRIPLFDFQVIRTYLEQVNDLAILADVIGIVATSFDSNVLSAAADTLHYHHIAFRAIGAFESLFEKIAMRYAAIRTVQFPERDLLHSLNDLAQTAQADPQLMQLLSYDISRYDQKNSIAVCSPVSDNMMEGIAASDIEDEIERILSSGTSMDQQMMNRVFGKITKNLEEQICQGSQQVDNFSTWLYRLKNFEESTFDTILTSWLRSLLIGHQAQLLSAALPPLVASGCLALTRFLRTVQECVRSRQTNQPVDALRIATEGLDKILPSEHSNDLYQPQDAYRFRLEQYKFCRQQNGGILDLINDVIGLEQAVPSQEYQKQISDILSSDRFLEVLRHFAVSDMQSLLALTVVSQQRSAEPNHACFKSVLDRLLDPVRHLGFSEMGFEQQVVTIVESTDHLSLPFCQLELQQIFSISAFTAENLVESVSAALLAAIKSAVEKDQPCWSDLISGLEPGLATKIREHAEREIITASAFLCGQSLGANMKQIADKQASVRKYLSVVDATTTGPSLEAQASLLLSLVERFKGAAEMLSKGIDEVDSSVPDARTVMNIDICYWIEALLRLAIVYGPSLVLKASNQHQAALMWALRGLISHPSLENFPSTVQQVFDVAALLSDSVSDDVRKHLARLDIIKAADAAHGAFIFGSVPPPDGWLNLTKPISTSSTTQSASSPKTQPQPLNVSQPPYQSQQQQSPSPLQRSFSQQQLQQQAQPQAQARGYPQYPQQKMLPQQLQRMGSGSQASQLQQLQQMQQMQQMQAQALAQQRLQPSPSQQQRAAAVPSQSPVANKGSTSKQEKVEVKTIPFALSRWEILPDSGGNATGNETAISLSLFGARRA